MKNKKKQPKRKHSKLFESTKIEYSFHSKSYLFLVILIFKYLNIIKTVQNDSYFSWNIKKYIFIQCKED